MRAGRLLPVALALLLAFAGCNVGPTGGTTTADTATTSEPAATPTPTSTPPPTTTPASTPSPTPSATPTATATPASTPTPTPSRVTVPVEGGSLPVDATRTFRRVQSLVGTDVEPRPVEARNLSEWRGSLTRLGALPLNSALGYDNVTVDWSQPTGVTRRSGYVYVHPGEGSPGEVERVLAHEYAHMLQFRASMLPWMDRLSTTRPSLDRIKTRLALVEGGAVFVADAYTDRYLEVRNNSAQIRELYRTRTDSHRAVLSHYHFGRQYVGQRIDDPANLGTVYEDHPRTTEQVMHGYTPSEEPPRPLSVSTEAPRAEWRYVTNNTIGEMFTRTTLRVATDRATAAEAAAGWGNDDLAVFQHTRNRSRFGWTLVHRWDSPEDADEAAAALRTYADQRAGNSPLSFRTVRLGEETTALVFGDPAFVGNASVSGSGGNVSVSVGR